MNTSFSYITKGIFLSSAQLHKTLKSNLKGKNLLNISILQKTCQKDYVNINAFLKLHPYHSYVSPP